ncbi:hypothetical protein TNCV_2662441 [Trichonephila clavipes]|nr:hypothetical protein TNCV_2662441 [Trichonephila clavipes]
MGRSPIPCRESLILKLSLWIFPAFMKPCDLLKDLEHCHGVSAMLRENSVERISIQCGKLPVLVHQRKKRKKEKPHKTQVPQEMSACIRVTRNPQSLSRKSPLDDTTKLEYHAEGVLHGYWTRGSCGPVDVASRHGIWLPRWVGFLENRDQ